MSAPGPSGPLSGEHGIDRDVLRAWLDERDLGSGDFTGWDLLAGGTQNVLLRIQRTGLDAVLRRPPLHLRRNSNEVLRREMRVLQALAGSDVPHPGFIAGSPDESVMGGAVFYLMEPVDGFNPSVESPPAYEDAAVQAGIGPAMAVALAALGAVDHEAAGLADLGKVDGFLDRQVDRWLDELATYDALEGYPGPDLPDVAGVAAWLRDRVPATFTPGIIHGDYHLANVMLRRDEARMAAIVDWEMCTVGDPLLDLGWLIATWPNPPSGSRFPHLGGLDAIIETYRSASTRDLAAIEWYGVLGCFKLGIILEGTNARADAGKAPRAIGDLLHATAVGLFHRAHALIADGLDTLR